MRTLFMLMTIRRENLRHERLRTTPFFGAVNSPIFVSSLAVAFSLGLMGCSKTSKSNTAGSAESSLANQAEHKRYEERLQKMDARFPVGDKLDR